MSETTTTSVDSTTTTSAKKIISQRYTISNTFSFGKSEEKVILREFGTFDVKGAVIIEGFPSNANSPLASACASYIVDQLDLPFIGDIFSESFPPISLVKGYTPQSGCRIFGNNQIVVFTSEYELKDPGLSHAVVNSIFDFAKRNGCKSIVSLEAIPMDEKKKKLIAGEEDAADIETPLPRSKDELIQLLTAAASEEGDDSKKSEDDTIYFVTNDQTMAETLLQYNHCPIKENMVISGITSIVLNNAPFTDIIVVGMFAPITVRALLSTKPIITLIHAIDKLIGGDVFINTEKLEKTGKVIKEKLDEALEKQKETREFNPMFL